MLKVNNINVFYGKLQALWDVSFHADEKEIVALVGANGAGKSTILNTISNLIHPTSGTVEFVGMRIDKMPPYRIVHLGIAHIPEGRKIFPDLTVGENLELGAYVYQAWKKRKQTLEQIYQIFPILKERSGQLARALSGGEQQMLAIGRGLMSKPRLCMFDEPSSGLAPLFISEIFEVIKVLREQGTTILLVEQNTQRALEIADRAYVLQNGRIVLEGESKTLLNDERIKRAYLGL